MYRYIGLSDHQDPSVWCSDMIFITNVSIDQSNVSIHCLVWSSGSFCLTFRYDFYNIGLSDCQDPSVWCSDTIFITKVSIHCTIISIHHFLWWSEMVYRIFRPHNIDTYIYILSIYRYIMLTGCFYLHTLLYYRYIQL